MRPSIPRRLLAATLVGLSTLAMLMGALGAASASEGEAMPATFRLALPRGGDAATLERLVETGQGEDRQTILAGRVEVRWLPEEPWLDAQGRWHAAHRRMETMPEEVAAEASAGGLVLTMPPMDERVVATHGMGRLAQSGGYGGTSASGTSSFSGQSLEIEYTTQLVFGAGEPCGLEAALHAGVPTSGPFLVMPCEGAEPVEYQATGVVDHDGIPAVRFEATLQGARRAVEYNAAIPFPFLDEVWVTDGPAYHSLDTLVGFEPGTDAWDTGLRLPADRALPEVAVAPRAAWGADDAGVDHPFTLGEAWRSARADPATGFDAYLAATPGAQAVWSEYEEVARGASMERTWRAQVAGDGSGGMLSCTRTTQPVGYDVVALLGLTTPERTSTECSFMTEMANGGWDPPQQFPTVASALAFWDAWNPEGKAGNAWGIHHAGDGTLAVGQSRRVQPGPSLQPPPPQERRWNETMLAFLPDGTPHSLIVGQVWSSTSPATMGIGSGPQAIAPQLQAPAGPDAIRVAGLAWQTPSAPVAAGASLLSAISAALYFLWPGMKAGGLGLFTRVQGPRLAEHPKRRQILDAVAAHPGIHIQELARTVGGGNGTVEHHLRRLTSEGLVVRRQMGKYACLFPVGHDLRNAGQAGAVKSEGARRVLEAVRAAPGASNLDIAQRTGLDAATVSYHVARLADAGLVHAERSGRSLSLRAAA